MNALTAKVTRSVALACAAATLVVSGAAFAGAPAGKSFDTAPAVTVRYDDLNLGSDRGTAALYRRIANAARQVCPDEFSRDLTTVAASRACQAQAIARAVQDVNSPKLALVHEEHLRHG